jgi:4-hydroxythreonine-4-phosphate dehydrogenase
MKIGITLGDVCGIGPEVILKAIFALEEDEYNIIIIGDAEIFKHLYSELLKEKEYELVCIEDVNSARFERKIINVFDMKYVDINKIKVGEICREAGKAAVGYIKKAVSLALSGQLDAIVTAPISKEAINKAGFYYQGHTQLLSELTSTVEYAMLFYSKQLIVVLVTIHVPLRDVSKIITQKKVLRVITLGDKALRQDFNIPTPRIAVTGLNPHAGEKGLFGKEDTEIIQPAIDIAIQQGINVSGPYPADTVFFQAISGKFDLVVAMYHDQGLIPLKLLAFESAVNVTIGLPIIRTSPDHGTAFDIAGGNMANPQSMIEAIRLAKNIILNRDKYNRNK